MDRADILDEAKKCVCGGRERDYGRAEDNFATIARFWNAYYEAAYHVNPALTGKDVAVMMALLKIARIACGGGSGDSYVDLAGYAACAGEIAWKEADQIEDNA